VVGALVLGPDAIRLLFGATLLAPLEIVTGVLMQPLLLLLAGLAAAFAYWHIR
jgi:hypothetical protein